MKEGIIWGIVWGMLGIFAWKDGSSGKLPRRWLLTAVLAGAIFRLAAGPGNWETAAGCLLPGLGVLGLSRGSRGAIGSGDGWVLLAVGWFLGGWHTFQLLWGGLLLASLWAVTVFFRKRNRKERLPFIPFLWAAHSLYLLGHLGSG